jgi:hypothetical protein
MPYFVSDVAELIMNFVKLIFNSLEIEQIKPTVACKA